MHLISKVVAFCFLSALIPMRGATIILTSDEQLRDLSDPDRKIDLSTGLEPRSSSLRGICETAQAHGDKVLTIAFDEFFRQYRKQAGTERHLTPDMDEYVDRIKAISDFAARYQMGIGLSLLSPLELGQAFKKSTGESGRWLSYKVGYRDPTTGRFSIPAWQQIAWTNNKGKFPVKLKAVRAFAFKESRVGNSPFRAVSRDDILEIPGVQYESLDLVKTLPTSELWSSADPAQSRDLYFESRNLRVHDDGTPQLPGYNRVMVLLEYETPEMDYFSAEAAPFLQNLLKKYHDRGINLVSLYSDEMHIQQDWYYFIHHENGQFNTRYLTPSFSDAYLKKFGEKFEDKDILYFVYGAPAYGTSAKDVRNIQYAMGARPQDIQRTFLFRDRYYKMLNGGVVDLFKAAKSYGNGLFGRELTATGHATWAESPTIDLWDTEKLRENAAKYEYTSNYVWGNTVQQASAACDDYFKWGEYLEPTGNDYAECGWLDRDYYGAAMAASIGVINKFPQAYAAAWGMPDESHRWKVAINRAFGSRDKSPGDLKITGDVHRDIETLILYPLSLVAVEERFGSWMTQYAYANYLTAEKLLELGHVTADGRLKVGDRSYRTLVALFEPLPAEGLLPLMRSFVEKGGTLVWCGPPPLLNGAGVDCSAEWRQLVGVTHPLDPFMGEIAAGRKISFVHGFSSVPEQTILTDFVVDRIYPVSPGPECEILAQSGARTLGTGIRRGHGKAYYMGFRPRDDQSASLGYETRTLFEMLNASGAYPGTGKFPGVNDNPAYISRTTDYLATRFPNGSDIIVRHYRTHAENWDGGFSRNEESDRAALAVNPMPSEAIHLDGMKVDGHEITYDGKMMVAFRTDARRKLIAFEGHDCSGLKLDGASYRFSQQPFETIAFAPDDGKPGGYIAFLRGQGGVLLPIAFAKGSKPRITLPSGEDVPYRIAGGEIELTVTPKMSGKRVRIAQGIAELKNP